MDRVQGYNVVNEQNRQWVLMGAKMNTTTSEPMGTMITLPRGFTVRKSKKEGASLNS